MLLSACTPVPMSKHVVLAVGAGAMTGGEVQNPPNQSGGCRSQNGATRC